jgi:hypothetical protein
MRHFRATPLHNLLCRQPACHQLSSCMMPAAQDKHGEMLESQASRTADGAVPCEPGGLRRPLHVELQQPAARHHEGRWRSCTSQVCCNHHTCRCGRTPAAMQKCPAPGAGERSPSCIACVYNMPARHAVVPSPPPLCAPVLGWGSRKELAVSAGGCCAPLASPLHPSAGAAATVDAWPAVSKSSSATVLLFAG